MSSVTVRAKFRCDELTDFGFTKRVKLSAVCQDGIPDSENTSFNKYTPHGELTMTIDNEHAAIQFVPNEEYYLDFSRVPKKTDAGTPVAEKPSLG